MSQITTEKYSKNKRECKKIMNKDDYKDLLETIKDQNQIITFLTKMVFNLAKQPHNYNQELANISKEAVEYFNNKKG